MSELPQGWASANLLTVANMVRGVTYTKDVVQSQSFNNSVPVLRANNIQKRGFDLSELVHVPNELVSEGQKIRKGDVVIASSSGSISVVGKAAQAHRDMYSGFGAFCTLLRHDSILNANYFGYFFSTDHYRSTVSKLARGSNINNLKREHFASLEIPIAPAAEQTRIANQLDPLLARVQACNDRFDAIPALLKRFRQTVLRAATSGDLTVDWRRNNFGVDAVSDFTEVRVGDPYSHAIRAPKLWKESSLGATCDFVGGSQPPKSTFTYENGDDLVRLIQIRDYKSDRHTTYIPKKLARRFCNKTDVMIGRYGPPIFQILRGLEGAYNVALMKAVPRTKDIDLEYLYVFLRGDQLLKFIEAGSDRTAGQDGVRKELLTPYPIFLPSLSEQAEIVRRVEALFALADRIETRGTAARTQAQRLSPLVLAKAFRGELVPQDPNDEPASVLLARIGLAKAAAARPAKKAPIARKQAARKTVI